LQEAKSEPDRIAFGSHFAQGAPLIGDRMTIYKTLDDYCVSASPTAFKTIWAMIGHDFVNGIIDRSNYDELLEDLQTQIGVARGLFRASGSVSG